MRRIPYVSALFMFALSACSDDPRTTPEYQQLTDDARRAEARAAERDSVINELFGTFNRISENLRAISAQQGQLSTPVGGVEDGQGMEERIMADIGRIDELMKENRELIARMRRQASASSSKMSEVEKALLGMEESMREKDEEIAGLKEELSSTNSSLATLIAMYRDKAQLSTAQAEELNTAWYVVGSAKELRDEGILTKEGGVAGIGGVRRLNTADLPKERFTRVDVTRFQSLPLLAKKAKLVTSHPDGSYRLDTTTDQLVITDPQAFWSISRYLVVVID